MRRIAGQIWSGDDDGELIPVLVEIDRTDENEISISIRSEDLSLYFTADYEARELVNAITDARSDARREQ